jgi:ribulose-phosphate 3-epimerase
MDGVFVPNYSLGIQDIEAVCRLSSRKSEVHLMIVNPGKYIHKFADLGVDIIYIHPDSDYHPSTVIQLIMETGAEPGIVLSPGTSVDSVKDLLRISKYVLVMTVNPGHAGQPFLPYVDEKIQQLVNLKEKYGFEIGLDGACSPALIEQYYSCGVDSFILGSAALFHNQAAYGETMKNLRSIVNGRQPPASRCKTIKFFITDVDGTLTDGKINIGSNGEMLKAFDIKDGYAINEMLPDHGITPVIITGRESRIVENRAKELGVKLVFQSVQNKLSLIQSFAAENRIGLDQIAYIGDDMNDLDCIKACGLSGCPADAADEIKKYAGYISPKSGGQGAVRDFAEYIIKE